MLRTVMLSLTPLTPGRRQQMPRTIRSIFTPPCDARKTALSVFDFAFDQRQQPLVQVERRDEQSLHGLELANAREQIEQVRHILAELRLAREQPHVGIEARGAGIVIAG